MIKIEELTKKIKIKNKTQIILKNINLEFQDSKFYAIMGESGSGKSTLLHMIGLLDEPTTGFLKINDALVYNLKQSEKALIRNKDIGFIFQSYYLNNDMNSYENVILPLLLNKKISKNNMKEKVINILSELGLKEKIKNYPNQLSGGEQQRVAIARALINNPKIIIADEPTANLDSKNESYVLNLFKDLSKKGVCVIVSCHSDIIKDYADEIIYLEKGRIKNTYEV